MSKRYDLADALGRYEAEEMTGDEAIELFQYLVDTGLAWSLQGHYGRTARELIEAGEVSLPLLGAEEGE